jgi:TolB-like protein
MRSRGRSGLGLADDIITDLANLEGLRVRPTRSVLPHRGPAVDLQQAGRALKADNVLSGTVRKTNAGFRVSVQLVRVADGASYWGESYDVATGELPALKDRITQQVSEALGVRMSAPEKAGTTSLYRQRAARGVPAGPRAPGALHGRGCTAAEADRRSVSIDYARSRGPGYGQRRDAPALRLCGEVKAWGEPPGRRPSGHWPDPNWPRCIRPWLRSGKTDFEWDLTIEKQSRPGLAPARLPYSYSRGPSITWACGSRGQQEL